MKNVMLASSILDVYELTPLQEGMLYHTLKDIQSSRYVLQNVYSVNTYMDADRIQDSLRLLCQKHDVLRTAIIYEKLSKTRQLIIKDRQIEYLEIDLRCIKQEEQVKQIDVIIKEDLKRGFDLRLDSLLRVTHIRVDDASSKMVWTIHHIIVDGWCLSILIRNFWSYYNRLGNGESIKSIEKEEAAEKESVGKYGEYVSWIKRQDNTEAMEYWRRYLSGYKGAAGIEPMIKGELSDETSRTKEIQLSENITKKLQIIAVQNEVTMNTIVETAWGLVLQRYNTTDDVVFGKVISGRNADIHGIEKMVGLFINTIPCRVSIHKGMRINELLKEMQNRGSEEINYSFSSLAEIQKESTQGRDLIQTLFVFENYYIDETNQDDLVPMKLEDVREETNYAITIVSFYHEGQLYIKILHDPREYSAADMDILSGLIAQVLKEIAQSPYALIEDMEMVTLEEVNQILNEFNNTDFDYPRVKTVIELFEEQVERTPIRTALVYEGQKLTYQELNIKAKQLAIQLRRLGVKPNDFIAIIAERSIEMIVGIYGIIKSGGAYVPIDPDYPAERIQYMLDDCQPKAILVYQAEVETDIPVINIGNLGGYMTEFENPEHVNQSKDLIYCIYTSGTTGLPKGVMVEHKNVVRLFINDRPKFDFNESDVWIMCHSHCFDFSVWEIFGSTLFGGNLIILSKTAMQDIYSKAEIIRTYGVTVLNQVPSSFYNLLNVFENAGSLRYLIFGGEALLPQRLSKWHTLNPDVKIINMYGITETTVHVTYKEIEDKEIESGISNIGKAIPTLSVYIQNNNKLCGFGIPGELCIAGEGLALYALT